MGVRVAEVVVAGCVARGVVGESFGFAFQREGGERVGLQLFCVVGVGVGVGAAGVREAHGH